MSDLEIDANGLEDFHADSALQSFNARVDAFYGGYFPDSRGVSLLASDFVKGAAASIEKHLKNNEPISFINEDTAAQDLDDLRSSLKIDSYRAPLLTIAKYLVNDWIVAVYGDKNDQLTSLIRAYADNIFVPSPKNNEDGAMNAATYLPEGPELAKIFNETEETHVEHLSGDHMQDGAFLLYDGTQYSKATEDPNMTLFE